MRRWCLGSDSQQVRKVAWLCAGVVLCGAHGVAWAAPNVPARVAPPTVEAVAPIVAPPAATQSGPLQAETAAGPIEVVKAKPVASVAAGESRSAARVPAVLAQLLARQMSLDEAWQSGALNADDLHYVFENYLSPWGLFDERNDANLRRALMALLVQHDGERFKDVKKLSLNVRLWLADYYWSVKDERVLLLAENILSEVKQPVIEGSIPAFLSVERLAWYYRDLGQPEKAARTWLRVKDYEPSGEWWVSDGLVEAAALYNNLGQVEKAKNLYAQVPQDGSWYAAIAVYDQAGVLLKQGQHEKALQIIEAQLRVQKEPAHRAALLTVLAQVYYTIGDFAKAEATAQLMLAEESKVANPSEHGLDTAEVTIKNIQKLSRLWGQNPLVCIPNSLNWTREQPQRRFQTPVNEVRHTFTASIRCFKSVPLQVTCTDPSVTWKLIPQTDDDWGLFDRRVKGHYTEWRLEVTVPTNQKLQAVLQVTSSALPEAQCNLPIQVEN